MKKVITLLAVLLATFLAGCASTSKQAPVAVDVSHYLDLTIEDGKTLPIGQQTTQFRKYWTILKRGRYKEISLNRKDIARNGITKAGCVQVRIAINEEGRMSAYSILQSYPEGVYDKKVIEDLKLTRWQATEFNADKTPVITTVKIKRSTSYANNLSEATKICGLAR